MFLEWWSTTKSLSNIWQHFSSLLDKRTAKICKKNYSHDGFLRTDQPTHGKKLLPDWLDWLSYLAGSSKSHHDIWISCILLKYPHQVHRTKKCCQMVERLLVVFNLSRNILCLFLNLQDAFWVMNETNTVWGFIEFFVHW